MLSARFGIGMKAGDAKKEIRGFPKGQVEEDRGEKKEGKAEAEESCVLVLNKKERRQEGKGERRGKR